MKSSVSAFAVVAVMLTVWFANVECVPCTTNNQCNNSTSCSGANTPICEHPDLTDVNENGGLCTCSVGLCNYPAECQVPEVDLECPYDDRHCYDNKCICSRFPVFPG
ncbi:uncharacterized protein LOC132740654 [Ruditapes philippinarum]|uniref:uncharacterized protein LOC132740654 n=1 Tax=Ruditapes philippinarum TaxID=129788 RepID=UPI00295C1360|nr:uncharacterized protein LOC132740654 [Ruditapes philippinarum]